MKGGDEGAKKRPATYLPCRREHNRDLGPRDRATCSGMGPPAAIFLRYSLRLTPAAAARRQGGAGRRKPVAFFNEKQALIDMRVLLAER